MRRVLVFQHVPYEILGTFHPLLKKAGLRIRYANFGRHPDLEVDITGYDGVVVLGGPMGVYEADRYPHLTHEVKQIELALSQKKPVFGICLGAQLLAAALGAPVKKAKRKEIGWFDILLTEAGEKDPLLGHLKTTEPVFQWHGDNLDLPKGANRLATSPDCPNQAFRYGENAYGLQFHLEVDEAMIHRWLRVPSMRKELEEFAGSSAPDEVIEATHHRIHRLKTLSTKVFSTYLKLFSSKVKRTTLGSGHR